MIWFAAALVSFAALAWGFRLAGQAATGRAPWMPGSWMSSGVGVLGINRIRRQNLD